MDVGRGTPLKFKSGTPESQSKFESGTPGPLNSVKMRPICDALHDLVPDVARFCTKRRSNGWPKPRSNYLECIRTAKSGKRFSQSVCVAFKLSFDI